MQAARECVTRFRHEDLLNTASGQDKISAAWTKLNSMSIVNLPSLRSLANGNVADINLLASFLAAQQIKNLRAFQGPIDCVVLCGSAILHTAETLFAALLVRPKLAETIVICGGIGHSTQHLYEAVAANPKYSDLRDRVQDLPESRVLWMIGKEKFGLSEAALKDAGCQILIEDQSTNCGANAVETIRMLREHSITPPETLVVMQDPTMSRRTLAGFEKACQRAGWSGTKLLCYPTFVPKVQCDFANAGIEYDCGIAPAALWSVDRFVSLLVGEIPRMRDDEDGYGPRGKGFIAHVDIPPPVEDAWQRLCWSSGMFTR